MDWLADKIVAAQEDIRRSEELEQDQHADPRDRHEAASAAVRWRRELERMQAARALSEQLVRTLGQAANTLRVAGYESRARSAALHHLETACLWLMTETK